MSAEDPTGLSGELGYVPARDIALEHGYPQDAPVIETGDTAGLSAGPAVTSDVSTHSIRLIRQAIAGAQVRLWEWHEANSYLTIAGKVNRILLLDPTRSVEDSTSFFPSPAPEDLEVLVASLNDALENGRFFQLDLCIDQLEGRPIWMSCSGGPVVGEEDGPRTVVGTLVDITARKKAENELLEHKNSLERLVTQRTLQLELSEEKFRSVVEGTPDFIFLIDDRYCITYENHLGILPENPDSIENSFLDRLPLSSRDEARRSIRETFLSGTRAVFEVPFALHGRLNYFLCRTSPVLQAGERVAVAILATDITKQKEDALQIQALNEDLEKRIDNRTEELYRLLRAASLLSDKLSRTPVLRRLVRIVDEMIPTSESVYAFELNQPEDTLKLVACRSEKGRKHIGLSVPIPELLQKQIKRLSGLHFESPFLAKNWGLTDYGLGVNGNEILVAPLRLQERLAGLLLVVNGPESAPFTESDRGLLGGILSQTLVALKNEQLLSRTRNISVRLLNAQDTERSRIAQELHDEVGGLLTSVQISLSMIESDELNVKKSVSESLRLVRKLGDEVRSLSLSLRSSTLDDFGLKTALTEHLDRFTRQTGIEVVSSLILPDDLELPDEIETAAFRIIQESLTNVARHSGASSVTVSLGVEEDMVRIEVVDSGRGFDMSHRAEDRRHLGISGVLERAELLHGFADIKSEPGEGTRVRANIPLYRSRPEEEAQ
jgi:nitrate/nitrite-specific signal transduction histidine kinase/PAS domain-containing protein